MYYYFGASVFCVCISLACFIVSLSSSNVLKYLHLPLFYLPPRYPLSTPPNQH